MAKRKKINWTQMYDILGNFHGLAWKRNSTYTSYLLYVEPWGRC
jgi:hypothetical protein